MLDCKAYVLNSIDRTAAVAVRQGERLLDAARDAGPESLQSPIAEGAPINYPDPRNGATALHYIAAQGARPALRVLLKAGKLDFLAADDEGRLAAELAGLYGNDLPMERFLRAKAIRQAREAGLPLEQIYRRDAPFRTKPPLDFTSALQMYREIGGNAGSSDRNIPPAAGSSGQTPPK